MLLLKNWDCGIFLSKPTSLKVQVLQSPTKPFRKCAHPHTHTYMHTSSTLTLQVGLDHPTRDCDLCPDPLVPILLYYFGNHWSLSIAHVIWLYNLFILCEYCLSLVSSHLNESSTRVRIFILFTDNILRIWNSEWPLRLSLNICGVNMHFFHARMKHSQILTIRSQRECWQISKSGNYNDQSAI